MDIEIRHARIVTAIAAAGSISRAATLLNLPQPSLSAQLRRIERALGGDLFVRSARGLSPTPMGERLVPMLAELAQQAEAVAAEAQRRRGEQPVVRFGHPGPTPVSLFHTLRGALPGHVVETFTMESDAITDAVVDAALTAGLVATTGRGVDSEDWGGLRAAPIGRESICVVVADGHPFSAHHTVGVDELMEQPWIRRAPGDWYRIAEDRLLGGAAPANVLHHASGHGETVRWVRETGAVALVPPWFSLDGTCLLEPDTPDHLDWHLIWRHGGLADDVAGRLTAGLRHYLHVCSAPPSRMAAPAGAAASP